MSYMQVENVITSVMKAKYKKTLKEFTDKDKEKLMNMLKNMFTTNLPKKNVEVVINFLRDNYTDSEIKEYVDYILEQYKPGKVYQGIRISNHTIVYFLEGLETYPLMKGIIINKKYINDLLPFFDKDVDDADDFDYNKDSLMVEKDYTDDMLKVFNGLVDDTDIRFHSDDNIFVLATFDDGVAKSMEDSFKGLEVQSLPVHKFEWSKSLEVVLATDGDKIEEVKEVLEIPPSPPKVNIPKNIIFNSDKPTDVLISGLGYGNGIIDMYDDYYSITIKHNNKVIDNYFETDGGFNIIKLKNIKSSNIDEAIQNNMGDLDMGISFSILRNFVGKIEMIVKVNAYDSNDNKKTFYIKPEDYPSDDLIYGLQRIYEDKGYGDADVDITLNINGTFDKAEPLTKSIYNSI